MKKFNELLVEASETIVFTFGRFNPPTIGHEKLIEKVASIAGSNPYRIYPSHTQNPKKDPLPWTLKVAYMRWMFPKHRKNIIAASKMKTAIIIAEALYKEGFKNLIMVVGSDRVQEFSTLLNRYNDAPDKKGKQLFKFDSVKVVSAGERDPDSEGIGGMSASKMRVAAADGDKDAFMTGLPKGFETKRAEKLYRVVRDNMGIREERDMGDMSDFETVRDMYLTGKIWNAGDIVEAKGITGEVVRKGTNYLSFVDEDGKIHKAWLHDITLTEDYSVYKKTATQAKNKSKWVYAFGRDKKLDGQPTEKGGYVVWKLEKRYAGHVKGGIAKNWAYVGKDLSYEDSVKLMNKKLGYKAFDEEVELDERNYRKEYDNYQGRPEQIARRSSRNQARRILGDKTKIGMDVGHKDNDPMNNDPKNLRNEDPSKNRREPRLREKELDEDSILANIPWFVKLKDFLHKKSHPKGYEKLAMRYAKEFILAKEKGKDVKPYDIWHSIARENKVRDRVFRDYINDLVKKGKLPKELKAEHEPQHETLSFKDFVNQIQTNEVLSKDTDAGEYIKDFEKSDAPQFKGKSKEKRKKMAIAAYLDNKRNK